MQRLVGLSQAKLETREGVMEGLARNGIRAAVRSISLSGLVTAAAAPTISTTASSSAVATLAPVELTAATNTWDAYVDAVLYPFLLETYLAASQQTYEFISGTMHVATPQVVPITAEDYLRVATNRLKNVGNVLWAALRDTLAKGYEAGESTHQLAARIRTVAKDLGESRALMIARTEVISAANAASLTQVQLGGFSDSECRKQWLATEDERTRPEHRLADGQSVGLSEAFFVGGEYLQHPGDPNGRADNVIQCRCTMEFIFVDDENLDNLVASVSGAWCAPQASYDFLNLDGPPIIVAADADWDESEHPRNKKGEFTKKGTGVLPSVPKLLEVAQKGSTGTVLVGINANVDKRVYKSGSGYKIQKLIAGKWTNVSEKLTLPQLEKKLHSADWDEPKASTTKAAAAGGAPSVADIDSAFGPLPTPAKTTPATPATPVAAPKKKITKPIHINTNVIYKQKYKNGAVVAVHPNIEGAVGRLIWSEPAKKFILQSRLDNGSWLGVELYGKGAAYQKFSKESGWLTADSTLPDLPSPTPAVAPVAAPNAPPAALAKKSIANMSYLDIDSIMATNTAAELAKKYDVAELNALSDKIADMHNDSELSDAEAVEYDDKIEIALGQKAAPMATPAPTKSPGYFGKPIMSSGDFKNAAWSEKVGWLKAAGPTELDVFSLHGLDKLEQQVHEMFINGDLSDPDYQAALSKISVAKLNKMGGAPPTVTAMKEVKSLADIGWDPKNASHALSFDVWFAKNLAGKKDVWDSLSANDKKMVEAATFNATVFGYDGASIQLSAWSDLDASGDPSEALIDKVKGMTNGEFQIWFSDPTHVDQDKWNSLSAEAKDTLSKKVDTLTKMGWPDAQKHLIVLKQNEPGFVTPPKVVSTIAVNDSDISGPGGASPAYDATGTQVAWVQYAADGSGAFIYSYDPVSGAKKNYVGSVDFEEGEVLEDEIQNFINNGSIKITPSATPSAAPPPVAKTPTPPTTPPPHGYNQHLIAHQNVKFVGDIGQPEVGVKTFKSVSTDEMKKIQHDMLLLSDKKKWTSEETAAVSFYGTSTGYQSMNGVLRNDETRLKLFSEAQLSSAAQSAVLVQSAMTPLTESLELHRGTGGQQFGFKTMKVPFAKLKKLEGETITDRGFVSSSVVAPTAISYDYAKKPIKVIIKAPKGTPAVYVDSVKPGHGENELLLGAGLDYHVDEVREATDGDKAQYGAGIEQIVVLTVVPTAKKEPKDISGAATVSKSATATTNAPSSLKSVASPAMSPSPTLKSTPTLGGPPGGAPIKLNTNVIHKLSYTHGAVVAVKKAPDKDGKLYRLVWNGSQKKFMLQLQTSTGTWLNAANLPEFKFTKKDAYNKFKDDTDWVTPSPGDTALGTSGFGYGSGGVSNTVPATTTAPTSTPMTHSNVIYNKTITSGPGGTFPIYVNGVTVAYGKETGSYKALWEPAGGMLGKPHKIDQGTPLDDTIQQLFGAPGSSGTTPSSLPDVIPAPINAPNSATVVPTPTATSVAPPLNATSIQAMHGDIPKGITEPMQRKLFDDFKKNSTQGFVVLNSEPETQFKALKETLDKWNATGTGVSHPLNLLQLLKIIDQESTNKANAIAKQKGEPDNLTNAQLYEQKIVEWLKTPNGKITATKVNSGVKDSNTVIDKLANFPDPHTIGTPSTKVKKFINLNHTTATAIQQEMFDTYGTWNHEQTSKINGYTGSDYRQVNGTLRQAGSVYANMSDSEKSAALDRALIIQSAMKPLPKSIVTYRGTGADFLPGLSANASFADIKQYEGKVFIDKGFSSSSIKKGGAFSQKVKLTIDVPEGTPAMYVENHTAVTGENEMLLAAGTKYYIRSVKQSGSTTEVHLAVVP